MKYLAILLLLNGLVTFAKAGEAPTPKLELKDGDRVAFIGNTFVEREQNGCYIETMLTSRFPQANVTFRNLGYSADTVTGSSRGLCTGWSTFEGADQAFDRLRKLVADFKPTVLLMNYGMTESFSGPEGIPTFVSNYNKMLDALGAAAGTSPRIVLMSPNYHEDLGRPLPDPAEHNKSLRLYSDAVSSIAGERKAVFVNLFAITTSDSKSPPFKPFLTSNGIHLMPQGYWVVSGAIDRALDFAPRESDIRIDADGKIGLAFHSKVTAVQASPTGMQFLAMDDLLPAPAPPSDAASSSADHFFQFTGLKPGTYELKANDRAIARGTAEKWGSGIQASAGAGVEQAEALRKLIVAKNFDFFAYQRPDNDAYILAFRKGEQGRNAVEIPRFLSLVVEKEKQIAELRVPKPVKYSLELVK